MRLPAAGPVRSWGKGQPLPRVSRDGSSGGERGGRRPLPGPNGLDRMVPQEARRRGSREWTSEGSAGLAAGGREDRARARLLPADCRRLLPATTPGRRGQIRCVRDRRGVVRQAGYASQRAHGGWSDDGRELPERLGDEDDSERLHRPRARLRGDRSEGEIAAAVLGGPVFRRRLLREVYSEEAPAKTGTGSAKRRLVSRRSSFTAHPGAGGGSSTPPRPADTEKTRRDASFKEGTRMMFMRFA